MLAITKVQPSIHFLHQSSSRLSTVCQCGLDPAIYTSHSIHSGAGTAIRAQLFISIPTSCYAKKLKRFSSTKLSLKLKIF